MLSISYAATHHAISAFTGIIVATPLHVKGGEYSDIKSNSSFELHVLTEVRGYPEVTPWRALRSPELLSAAVDKRTSVFLSAIWRHFPWVAPGKPVFWLRAEPEDIEVEQKLLHEYWNKRIPERARRGT